jgi:5'-nucleotidase
MKKILYFDMDDVLVNFKSGIEKLSDYNKKNYEGRYDEVPGIFSLMDPMEGSIEAFNKLSFHYDTYILSTGPWDNPTAWQDKILWVQKYLEKPAYKRLILSHHKNLNKGDYLIDDRLKNGADKFEGEHLHFGKERFPDWNSILEYLL